MYRTAFEALCDRIARMQTSLSEGVQWAVSALCFGCATTLLVRSLTVV